MGIHLDVCLTIDGNKLSQKYGLEPFNYLPAFEPRIRREAEERTKKPGSIKNIKNYIKEITIYIYKKRWPEYRLPSKFEILTERFLGIGNITFDNYIKYLQEHYNIPLRIVK